MIHLIDVSLSFGSQEIFDNLSWHIKPEKKIGLFGPNGAGKTTLLDLIAGVLTPDSGTVSVSSSITIGYLPQEVHEEYTGLTVLDEAMGAFKEVSELEKEAELITEGLNRQDTEGSEYKKLLARLDRVNAELSARDAHKVQYEAEKLLMGLGFETDELMRPLGTFSGGWRMRVALAELLLRKPDALLLDEPTNHLDIESIDWLEGYLKSFRGTAVLVSHDPYFLDRMVDSIAELTFGKITEYAGDYSFYLRERESRLALHRSAYENQQKQIRETERFIERFRYKASKARQAQSRIKTLEKMERIASPPSDDPSIHFRFPEPKQSGRDVLELSTFSKSYANKDGGVTKVFTGAGPLAIERGDKIALIGKNGAGKSTLARILLGAETFEGDRAVGYNVELTYFAQHQAESLNPSNTVFDELQTQSGENETRIRSLLGAFLFSGDDVFKPIGVLSGGEKSRVALAKTLLSPTNFMILDEPTNHLDIQSKNVLIEALKQYGGTFVVVSHDRNFLDRIVNKVWYVERGKVYTSLGNYSDYKQRQDAKKTAASQTDDLKEFHAKDNIRITGSVSETVKSNTSLKEIRRQEAEERNRRHREIREQGIENIEDWKGLSLKQLEKALALIEEKIRKAEERRAEIENLFGTPEFYKDKELSYETTNEYKNLESELNTLYEKWESVTLRIEAEEA